MTKTRKLIAVLLFDTSREFTNKELVEETGFSNLQVRHILEEIIKGKLVIRRWIRTDSFPWRIPLYSLNPERVDRARELVERKDSE